MLIVVDFRFSESYGDIVFVAAGVFTAVRCGRRRTGEFWASIGLVLALPAAFAVNTFSFLSARSSALTGRAYDLWTGFARPRAAVPAPTIGARP